MSLRSKPLEQFPFGNVQELLEADGSAREPASPFVQKSHFSIASCP
jgi:hypothetical protein